jgi:hypothetical protein
MVSRCYEKALATFDSNDSFYGMRNLRLSIRVGDTTARRSIKGGPLAGVTRSLRLTALAICGSALSIAAMGCSGRTTDVADAAVDAMTSYDAPSDLGTQSETAPTDAGNDADGMRDDVIADRLSPETSSPGSDVGDGHSVEVDAKSTDAALEDVGLDVKADAIVVNDAAASDVVIDVNPDAPAPTVCKSSADCASDFPYCQIPRTTPTTFSGWCVQVTSLELEVTGNEMAPCGTGRSAYARGLVYHPRIGTTGPYEIRDTRWTVHGTGTAAFTTGSRGKSVTGGWASARALAVGNVVITAEYGTFSGSFPITIVPAAAASLEAQFSYLAQPGMTLPLRMEAYFTNGERQDVSSLVTWQSSAPDIIQIDPVARTATALRAGTATLSTSHAGMSTSKEVRVHGKPLTMVLSVPSGTFEAGSNQWVEASAFDADGYVGAFDFPIWTSSAPDVAQVQLGRANGSYRALPLSAAGTATITATLSSLSGSATYTVTAPGVTGMRVEPTRLDLSEGGMPLFVKGTLILADGSEREPFSEQIELRSSNPVVLLMSRWEAYVGLAGTATLTARFGPHVVDIPVTVTP